MQLTHKILLNPTPAQAEYFQKAAGTARFVWNWALAKWNELYSLGKKPNAMALKKSFNAIKYEEFPWLSEMHRDSHAQPFSHLAKAWNRFFAEIRSKKPANEPRFKKKNRSRDSFYVANDKFTLNEKMIKLPKIGWVMMTEVLRFDGKILGATVSRTADKWFLAIQVDVPTDQANQSRTANQVIGVDFGIKAAATLSTGESIAAASPLKSALRRLKIRSRTISRKINAAKQAAGFDKNKNLPKGAQIPQSNNRKKSTLKLARLHARIGNLRADFTHKLTTRLCRENQAIVIEDLHVAGMLQNEKLARAFNCLDIARGMNPRARSTGNSSPLTIPHYYCARGKPRGINFNDVGFGTIRRQLEYKTLRYGNNLIIADRWYPSSKLCSVCHWKNDALLLQERTWYCPRCTTTHDRDVNAARNLKRLATETALPVANQLATNDTAIGGVPIVVGKVTPVRYECGQQDTSGQEENRVHICAHF